MTEDNRFGDNPDPRDENYERNVLANRIYMARKRANLKIRAGYLSSPMYERDAQLVKIGDKGNVSVDVLRRALVYFRDTVYGIGGRKYVGHMTADQVRYEFKMKREWAYKRLTMFGKDPMKLDN